MRPKKVILCIDDSEQDLSVVSFMLSTNGFRVIPAASGKEALAHFSRTHVDLVLADFAMPLMNGSQLVQSLKQIAAHIPMILLGDPKGMEGQIHPADALLNKRMVSSREILERIKVMSARKPGPRKGTFKPVNRRQICEEVVGV